MEQERPVTDKFYGLKPALAKELEFYEDRYFTFDEPIPFGNKLLYPVGIKHYAEFMNCVSVCLLNKNTVPAGIRMTHLEFLLSKMQDPQEGSFWGARFSRLLELTMHISNGVRCLNPDCQQIMSFQEYINLANGQEGSEKPIVHCPHCQGTQFREMIKWHIDDKDHKKTSFIIDGEEIDYKAFELFRQVVLFQNLPDYRDETWIDPSLLEDRRIRSDVQDKANGKVSASLEKKIVCVMAQTGFPLEQIYQLSIRKFSMLLFVVDDVITYTTTRIGQMSGMVKMKTPLEHWIYKKDKDPLGEGYVDKNDVQSI